MLTVSVLFAVIGVVPGGGFGVTVMGGEAVKERHTWVKACLAMEADRAAHPGDDFSRKPTERYSDDIEWMQREFKLRLIARKGVRV